MRMKNILIAVCLLGAVSSSVWSQTFANRFGKLVLAGGGTDLTNTLTLTSVGSLGAPKTFTFPSPLQGLMHSTAAGALSISLIDLNSTDVPADVSGILQPVNGGTGVANANTNTITLGGTVNISN